MKNNGITKEELAMLQRRRRRSLKYKYIMIFLVIFCVAIFSVIMIINKNTNSSDEPTTTEAPTTENKPSTSESTSTEASTTEAPASSTESGNMDATATDAMYDINNEQYTVPDTELAPVEEIEGENWSDETVYQKNKSLPIDLKYFEDTVFIGDSRTEGLMLYSNLKHFNGFCYKGLNVEKAKTESNIKIDGDDTLYTCYEAISKTQYNNYYIMFGINELGWLYPDAFIDKMNELIDHIYTTNPEATVYVESLISVTKEKSDSDETFTKDRVDMFNELLLNMCKERRDVIFLDLNSVVTDEDGYLPAESSIDGVHLNASYSKRIIQYIRCNTYTKIK